MDSAREREKPVRESHREARDVGANPAAAEPCLRDAGTGRGASQATPPPAPSRSLGQELQSLGGCGAAEDGTGEPKEKGGGGRRRRGGGREQRGRGRGCGPLRVRAAMAWWGQEHWEAALDLSLSRWILSHLLILFIVGTWGEGGACEDPGDERRVPMLLSCPHATPGTSVGLDVTGDGARRTCKLSPFSLPLSLPLSRPRWRSSPNENSNWNKEGGLGGGRHVMDRAG